ncbi:hypothetical protein H072_3835 [Dactylellina haptotyla CBS 200.50]|uniref:F-box domain-containing protein n=1 Tax=Dactylellina haptotyla (strain CBS 200.50) TaxID=1284197 RepID=S8AH59_DACHA|nr:hypothetical protein H072_3835 [Dactylellina haptotyla CBS 200.50]
MSDEEYVHVSSSVGETTSEDELDMSRTLEEEMAELENMLTEPMVFVPQPNDVDEGVSMEDDSDDDGIKLVGQEKWIFEHEKRMLQQEKKMLAHGQKMLAQEKKMFERESKMLKQQRWMNDKRKKLFEGEEDVPDVEEQIALEEKRIEEKQTAMDDRVQKLERRITDLEEQLSRLKTTRKEIKEKNKLTISNLPIEIQVEILSYLPWQYHFYCFDVLPRWRQAKVLRDLQPERYHFSDKNYCPRMHRLGADGGWMLAIKEGKIESVTYILELLKTLDLPNYNEDDEKYAPVDLLQSHILEDPLFSHTPADPEKEAKEVDKVAFQIGMCEGGYEQLFMSKDVNGNEVLRQEDLTFTFPFADHPELQNMQVIEFLDWTAKWFSGLPQLKEYKKITFELLNYDWCEMGFMVLLHDLRK